jgi:putative oxidoreductase
LTTSFLNQFQGITLNLLRIVAGLLYMQHGAQKLFGVLGGFGGEPGATAPLFSLMGVAGVLEFFGGLAIALGLLTRPVAFVLAGKMATAYFVLQHLPQGFWPILNGGELALLYMVILLFLVAHGAGVFSLDELRRRQREAAQRQAAAT